MELLDLQLHDPEDYEGKFVSINGGNYIIGPHIGTGAERIVHKLINRRSGLCLHVIKFWHETLASHESAATFYGKGGRAEVIAHMRKVPELGKVIPISIYIQGHGGIFELQDFVGEDEYEREKPIIRDYMREAKNLMCSSNYSRAISLYNHVLTTDPFHTIALHNLAGALASLGSYLEASETEARATAIEPNCLLYRGSHITYAANSGNLRQSIHLFEYMKSQFPYIHDYDDLAIQVYLLCGNPEKASELLAEGMISDDRIENLKKEIVAAISAKARSLPMIEQAKDLIMSRKLDDPNICRLLEKALSAYDKDAFLAINLGLALQRAGDFDRSSSLLLSVMSIVPQFSIKFCYANAAFSLIKASEFIASMDLLEITMSFLLMLHGGQEPTNLDELPGVAIWVEEQTAIEEHIESAANLINYAIECCPDKEKVTDSVRRLATLYKKAAAI